MNNKKLESGKAVNCFAYTGKGCSCLTVTKCKKCKFFKTNEQLEKEQERTKKRLAKLGKEFLING